VKKKLLAAVLAYTALTKAYIQAETTELLWGGHTSAY
jgi:hypothetical protein